MKIGELYFALSECLALSSVFGVTDEPLAEDFQCLLDTAAKIERT